MLALWLFGITTVGLIKLTECLSLVGWGLNMNQVYSIHMLHVAKHDILSVFWQLVLWLLFGWIWTIESAYCHARSNELCFGFMDLFYVWFQIMFSKRERFLENRINPVGFSQFSKPGVVADSNWNLIAIIHDEQKLGLPLSFKQLLLNNANRQLSIWP